MKGAGGEDAPPVLRLHDVTKRFGDQLANDGIGFCLERGQVVALLGENGAGKTTLMNILFGHYVADRGTVEAFGRVLPAGDPRAAIEAGVGMVHQHFTLADNLSVLDNVVLGTRSLWSPRLNKKAARARIAELSRELGLATRPDALVASLSVGERQRVEIVKALYRDARILILDEPTAVLTPGETEGLFATLRKLVARGLSILFISHKLHEVMAVSDRIVVLRGGRLVGERPTKGATRAELAALMVGREVAMPRALAQPAGAPRLQLTAVATAGGNGAIGLDGLSLTVHAGEILGVAGVSGNGQTVLAGAVAGTVRPLKGRIAIDGQDVGALSPRGAIALGIGRIPEDRHATGVIGDMSVTENAICERYRQAPFSRFGRIDWKAARGFALRLVEDYDVKCPAPETRVRLLSGGNMQKLILGRVLSARPGIILANQPTRGLDVGAVAYVHEQLLAARRRGAAILLVSEDLDEILALSDRVMVMSAGRLSPPLMRGAYDIAQLGELMAGHGFAGSEAVHAA